MSLDSSQSTMGPATFHKPSDNCVNRNKAKRSLKITSLILHQNLAFDPKRGDFRDKILRPFCFMKNFGLFMEDLKDPL